MEFRKIGVVSAFMIVILAVGILNHVIIIPILLSQAGRDSWFSVAVITIPYLLFAWWIYLIMKRTKQQQIFAWLQSRYGSTIAWIIKIPAVIYMFLICIIALKDTTNWVSTTFMPKTPVLLIAGLLAVICGFAARAGFPSIAVTAGILLPVVTILGYFVAVSNLRHKDYTLLMPLFEHGLEPFYKGLMYAGSGFVELFVIVFFQHHIAKQVRFPWLAILAVILVYLTIGPLTGSIAQFGPFESGIQRYPAYEQWRMVTIGKYIEHVDFFSIYQWLSGTFIRMSAAMFIIVDLLFAKRRQKLRALNALVVILIAVIYLPMSDMQFVTFLTYYYLPISLFVVIAMALFVGMLTLLPKAGRVKG